MQRFLGHIVGRAGLACDPNKLSAVRDWHEPTKLKGVRQFIGFVGYYRPFVKDFAKLADPLVSLTRKGVPFVWGSDQQNSFDTLKACLLCDPISDSNGTLPGRYKGTGPPGAVSWLTSKESSIKPSVTVLGASTMHRTRPSSLSLASAPSNVEGDVTGDQSARDCGVSITSSVDVSSATLISVHSGVKSTSVELDSSCVIHPFHVHKMDSGPVRLMTIAHAFNYRVAVLRDGVKSALRVGRS